MVEQCELGHSSFQLQVIQVVQDKSDLISEMVPFPQARIIYEDYVSILSPREVSLDSRVREIINRNMIAPSQGRTNGEGIISAAPLHAIANRSKRARVMGGCGSIASRRWTQVSRFRRASYEPWLLRPTL